MDLLDLRDELEALRPRYDDVQLRQLALLLDQHLTEQRGPAVLDAAAQQRYADVVLAAHHTIGVVQRRRWVRPQAIPRDLRALQTAIERSLPDVQGELHSNPRYARPAAQEDDHAPLSDE